MNYRELYEKHAKRQKAQGYVAIVSGVANVVAGLLLLRQLREDRKSVV